MVPLVVGQQSPESPSHLECSLQEAGGIGSSTASQHSSMSPSSVGQQSPTVSGQPGFEVQAARAAALVRIREPDLSFLFLRTCLCFSWLPFCSFKFECFSFLGTEDSQHASTFPCAFGQQSPGRCSHPGYAKHAERRSSGSSSSSPEVEFSSFSSSSSLKSQHPSIVPPTVGQQSPGRPLHPRLAEQAASCSVTLLELFESLLFWWLCSLSKFMSPGFSSLSLCFFFFSCSVLTAASFKLLNKSRPFL
mmetsp:Transcript_16153/g.43908  ORF Transcript_16153/g.43908 Transcript_16153/m.43908 type:complete len:248 (-) Transcript_16153:336-1079(-)